MRKIILATAVAALSAPAFAHHFSPAEPDIGDMMGMHDAAIERVLDVRQMDTDSMQSGMSQGPAVELVGGGQADAARRQGGGR